MWNIWFLWYCSYTAKGFSRLQLHTCWCLIWQCCTDNIFMKSQIKCINSYLNSSTSYRLLYRYIYKSNYECNTFMPTLWVCIPKLHVSRHAHIHTNRITRANLWDWWLPILNCSVFICKWYSLYIALSPAEFPDYWSLCFFCLCGYLQ